MTDDDLRALLFQLYLKNNTQLQHYTFIYRFQGIQQNSPFEYMAMELQPNMKKSIILQNLPSGEMMQAFIVPLVQQGKTLFQIENKVLYANQHGEIGEMQLDAEKLANTEKYQRFNQLAKALLKQFV